MIRNKILKYRFLVTLPLVLLVLLPIGCGGSGDTTPTTTTPTATTPPTTTTTTTSTPTLTRDPMEPPTVEELIEEHFWFPEFPRITAEKLWSMMEEEDKIIYGGMTWDNFFVIDVQEPDKYTKLHLPGALNIPNSYYWVLDPREDPKPEEWDAYDNEQETLERRLPSLPRDELIIVYDTTADDEPASRLATRLVDEFGFDPELVKVLWKGYYYWWLDLRYPVVAGDYAFPGE